MPLIATCTEHVWGISCLWSRFSIITATDKRCLFITPISPSILWQFTFFLSLNYLTIRWLSLDCFWSRWLSDATINIICSSFITPDTLNLFRRLSCAPGLMILLRLCCVSLTIPFIDIHLMRCAVWICNLSSLDRTDVRDLTYVLFLAGRPLYFILPCLTCL